jgi:hypothetical protein
VNYNIRNTKKDFPVFYDESVLRKKEEQKSSSEEGINTKMRGNPILVLYFDPLSSLPL